MNTNKNTNTINSLQLLQQEMGKVKYRGCYVRTAKKLNCTSNWIWKVINERTVASTDVVERIVNAALGVLEEMNKESQQESIREKAISQNIYSRLNAINA